MTKEKKPPTVYEIPDGTPPGICKEQTCRAVVYWVRREGEQNKWRILNPDGTSHFLTCTDPNKFSRGKKKGAEVK